MGVPCCALHPGPKTWLCHWMDRCTVVWLVGPVLKIHTKQVFCMHEQIRNNQIDSNQSLHINCLGICSNIFGMISKLVRGFRGVGCEIWTLHWLLTQCIVLLHIRVM